MGTILTNTFEGGTDGAAVTVNNSGGASGTAFGVLVYNNVALGSSTGNSNLTYYAARRARGNMGARIVLAAAVSYLRLDLVDTGARYVQRRYFYYETQPTGTYTLMSMYAGPTLMGSIAVTSDGKITPNRNAVVLTSLKSTSALTPGTWYAIELAITPESGAGGNGVLEWRLMSAAETQIETKSVGSLTIGSGAINFMRFGLSTTSSGLTYDYIDELRGGPLDSGWIGPVTGGAPTVNTSEATSYVVDARSSTGDDILTYSIAWSSGPNNLGSVVQLVDGVFTIPLATTSAVYVITASDGTLTTNKNVTVPASVAPLPDTTRRRTWNGSSWV